MRDVHVTMVDIGKYKDRWHSLISHARMEEGDTIVLRRNYCEELGRWKLENGTLTLQQNLLEEAIKAGLFNMAYLETDKRIIVHEKSDTGTPYRIVSVYD